MKHTGAIIILIGIVLLIILLFCVFIRDKSTDEKTTDIYVSEADHDTRFFEKNLAIDPLPFKGV